MKVCFIPIDNRPVCYNLAKDIAGIDCDTELLIPPRELLGGLTEPAKNTEILNWFSNLENIDYAVISLDTITYGGLIQSRRSSKTFDEIKENILKLKEILVSKKIKTYAFSSIMRISNNNFNTEEKTYWSEYGEKIFKYSYESSKKGSMQNAGDYGIPKKIINDYLSTRKRNFEINKHYLEMQKNGLFETLVFSKDDCAEYGFNIDEAKKLKELGATVQTGADEIPLTLLARTINNKIKIFPLYTSPENTKLISNYEDIPLEESVKNQILLSGMVLAKNYDDADLILLVNNFEQRQGEIVMKIDTKEFRGEIKLPDKPYMIADVRFANGADNNFVKEVFKQPYKPELFYGYSAWNTTANTLGSLLCAAKFRYNSKNYNQNAFEKLQAIRFADDWAYQANVRQTLSEPEIIDEDMKPYTEKINNFLNKNFKYSIIYPYPWNRLFEVEIIAGNL